MSFTGSVRIEPGEMAPVDADGGSVGQRKISGLSATGQEGLSSARDCLVGRGANVALGLVKDGALGEPVENGWNVTIGGHVKDPANPAVGSSLYVNVVCVPTQAQIAADIAAANAA